MVAERRDAGPHLGETIDGKMIASLASGKPVLTVVRARAWRRNSPRTRLVELETVVLTPAPETIMSRIRRTRTRLVPLAALSMGLLLPLAAHAQSQPGSTPESTPTAVADLPTSAAERQQLVGAYLLYAAGSTTGRAMPFRVYEQGGALYGQPQGGEPMRLLKQGERVFRAEREPESIVTFTVENGSATGFSVVSPDGTFEAVRDESGER